MTAEDARKNAQVRMSDEKMGLGGVWNELFRQEMTGVIGAAVSVWSTHTIFKGYGWGNKAEDKMSDDGYGWPSGK